VAVYGATIAYFGMQWRQQVALGDLLEQLRFRFGIAYTAASASFLLAGASWARNPRYGALEAFLTIGVAAAPLWFSLKLRARPGSPGESRRLIERSPRWLVVALLLFSGFLLTQGHGIGGAE
jgi:hypothetical protein